MDDSKAEELRPSPRSWRNPLSLLTSSYTFSTFVKGFKKDLEVEDLYKALPVHESHNLGNIFEKAWKKELTMAKKTNRGPSFGKVVLRAFLWDHVVLALIVFLSEIVLRTLQPFFIGLLIRYFSIANQNLRQPGENDPTYFYRLAEILREPVSQIQDKEAIFYASGIAWSSFLTTFLTGLFQLEAQHLGMKIRVGCCALLYRKALRLSQRAFGKATVGQIVNLLSNDVNRFDTCVNLAHALWIGPLSTVIMSYFMYQILGWSALLGIALILILVPWEAWLGKKMSDYRLQTAKKTDERIRLMNEIITGMQIIKMYTWEKPFAKLVALTRRQEMNVIIQSSVCKGLLLSFYNVSARIAVFLTAVAYELSGGTIWSEKIFLLLGIYNALKLYMIMGFPVAALKVSEAITSVNRIQEYMLLEENSGDAKKIESSESVLPSITIKNVTCQWFSKQSKNTLNNINLNVISGELVAVVGPVGSGKSSLLQVILKELPINGGSLTLNGVLSYASQESWVFPASFRQNVLFGMEYDSHRYQQVINICALEKDLQLLPYGDRTIVGERGVTLSGGQRARLNLARAVYRKADIYLLDDPLSAVDAHVGRHLFEQCIRGFLKDKIVILVTHQLHHLEKVDHIVALNEGKIEAEGTFNELRRSKCEIAKFLIESPALEDEKKSADQSKNLSVKNVTLQSTNDNRGDPVAETEQKSIGTVGYQVYGQFFSACRNRFLLFFLIVLYVSSQIVSSLSDYWISKWSLNEEINTYNANMTEEERTKSTSENIYIFTGINVVMIVVSFLSTFLFFRTCALASINLHDEMFSNIIRVPMRFFHLNPSGRILNRFSKDMGTLDDTLPSNMVGTSQMLLTVLGAVILVSIVSPLLLVVAVVVFMVYLFLQTVYLRTSRSVKRLEAIARSPVFSHANATLQGLTTVRALNAQEILIKEFDTHQDVHSSAWYMYLVTSRSFGLWLDFVSVVYVTVVTFTFLFWDRTPAPDAGLAITQSMSLTAVLQYAVRTYSDMEVQMTSCERILEYTDMKSEPPLESKPEKKPPPSWPENGAIGFEDAVLRYDPEGSSELHGVSFAIRPREKIGIVGRTGAGKSSLISALFRLVHVEGKIIIDSVDTSEIGLHDLRSKISIIPQEPILFSGTLRKNLDPFNEYPDWSLWQVLEEVELKEALQGVAGGLDMKMSQGGTNLSVGQRQLICLARAIIRNNKILVMDEATANVDPQTDVLVQKTIRRKFHDCTVLTIAHRLDTVMDSDRILVMDAGRAVEMDHPYLLLRRRKSFFYAMVQQTGPATSAKLTSAAKKNYKRKIKKDNILKLLEHESHLNSSSTSKPKPDVFSDNMEECYQTSVL